MGNEIQVQINGMWETVPTNSTIAQLMKQFQENEPHMIVEYEGRFVYPQKYDVTVVQDGSRIEFIYPDFGG